MKWRQDFPFLEGKTRCLYFDTAATAQKPRAVIDAISHFYAHEYATVHRGVYKRSLLATDLYVSIREKVRAFLGAAHGEEVIFTRGTTESINLVAQCFGKAFLQPGDEILVSGLEHHSNLVPWQWACQERGCLLKTIPVDANGDLILEAYQSLLSPKTRLVAVAHIANSIGTLNPIREMIAQAHQVGACVLVDGAQSASHLAVDVQELDADFFVFSGHKLYGPTGIGVLYGKKEWLDQMPPYQGGGDMVDVVHEQSATYQPLPLKFEAGTPLIAEVVGLGAALDYLEACRLESIAAHETQMVELALTRLQEIEGVRLMGSPKKRGAIVSFVIDRVHPLDLATYLDLHQIAVRTGHLCAQPVMRHFGVTGMVRLSFGLYNTLEEVEEFFATLVEILPSIRL